MGMYSADIKTGLASIYLDVASGVKAIQLIDNFKHGSLDFIVTTCSASASVGYEILSYTALQSLIKL